MTTWLSGLFRGARTASRRPAKTCRAQLRLETLEDRLAPAQVSWTGAGGNSDWTNPANWSTGNVPGPAADVYIGSVNGVASKVTLGVTESVNSLAIASGSSLTIWGGTFTPATSSTINGTLEMDNTGVLQANVNLTVYNLNVGFPPNGTLTDGGTVSGSATVTVTHQFIWNGGDMNGSGTTTTMTTCAATISASIELDSRTLNLKGTTTWNPSTTWGGHTQAIVTGGCIINNYGTLTTSGGSSGSPNGTIGTHEAPGTPAPQFNNYGTFRQTGGTGSYFFVAGSFSNSNTVDLQAGTLEVDTLANSSAITFTSFTYQLSGTFQIDHCSGTPYADTLTLNSSGTLFLRAGTFEANTLTNYTSSNSTLQGGTYRLYSTLQVDTIGNVVTNAATLDLWPNGHILKGNNAGALVNMAANSGTLTLHRSMSQPGNFQNSGTLNLYADAGVLTTFSPAGNYSQGSGVTMIAMNATLKAGSGAGSVTMTGGILEGAGEIDANVNVSGGNVLPGETRGPGSTDPNDYQFHVLAVNGNLMLGSAAIIDWEVTYNASAGGARSDDLDVTGSGRSITLGGAGSVYLVGAVPPSGTAFELISWLSDTTVTGILQPSPGNSTAWFTSTQSPSTWPFWYGTTGLMITAN
jgi:hypothetical protein